MHPKRKIIFTGSLLLALTCSGCYTQVHEPQSYKVDSFQMTEKVEISDMTVKPHPSKPKKSLLNLWGLFN